MMAPERQAERSGVPCCVRVPRDRPYRLLCRPYRLLWSALAPGYGGYYGGYGYGGSSDGGSGSSDFSGCEDDKLICCSGPCCSDIGPDEISDGPDDYGNSETCEWRFVSTSDSFALLFSEFNTESNYDYVRIYDCYDVAAQSCTEVAELHGDLTGSTGTYNSPASGIMKLVFTSDSSYTLDGFVAQCEHRMFYARASEPACVCVCSSVCPTCIFVFRALRSSLDSALLVPCSCLVLR